MEQEGQQQILMYSFFEKPTASPYVTTENSAWAWSPKHSSLAQNMVRGMSNIHEKVSQEARDNMVNN